MTRGDITMSEEEFDHLCIELEKNDFNDEIEDLQRLLDLKARIQKVNLDGYPGMLSKNEKFNHIIDTYEEVVRFGIQGKSLEKLKHLTKAINWVDGLLNSYKSNKLVPKDMNRDQFIRDFKIRQFEKKAKTEILEEYSFISMKKSESNVDRRDFKLFPDLKQILNCISNAYSSKMMSKFKKDKTISVTMMLKLANIREILKTDKIQDGLF